MKVRKAMSTHHCNDPICTHHHKPPTRRKALGIAVGCGISLAMTQEALAQIAMPDLAPGPVSPEAALHPLSSYTPRARRLVENSHVIDMLCNVRNRMIRKGEENSLETAGQRIRQWFADPNSLTSAELQRYVDSRIDVFHCATDAGLLLPGATPYDKALYYFQGWNAIFQAHPDRFLPILGPRELAQSRNTDKIAILLGLQNGNHFRTVDDIGFFYGLGQRTSQLTYNAENPLGGGSFTDVGLKPYGVEVIRAMNKVGMVLDLSHSNDATVLGAIDASQVTPIISHTNCRSQNLGFSRAVPDEVIKAIAARGGVIGLTVLRQFVSANEPTTIDDFIGHIDHVVEVAGINHVGIGSDSDLLPFDGVDDEARRRFFAQGSQAQYRWRERLDIDGLDHPRRMYDIADALIRKGYTDRDIKKILGGNFARVLPQIWRTRR
jgi:membrane dipeptidase